MASLLSLPSISQIRMGGSRRWWRGRGSGEGVFPSPPSLRSGWEACSGGASEGAAAGWEESDGGGAAAASLPSPPLPLSDLDGRPAAVTRQWERPWDGRSPTAVSVPSPPFLSQIQMGRAAMVHQRERRRDGRRRQRVASMRIARPRWLRQPPMSLAMTIDTVDVCMLKMQREVDVVMLDANLHVDWI